MQSLNSEGRIFSKPTILPVGVSKWDCDWPEERDHPPSVSVKDAFRLNDGLCTRCQGE